MKKEVEITALTYGGRGLGRIEGKVVFVPFSVPGDLLSIEVIKERKSYLEGRIKEIIRPSVDRVEPKCAVFGVCGGCAWQNISYPVQLEWKERLLKEALERIGGLAQEGSGVGLPEGDAVVAGEPYNYRSRARFQIDGAEWGYFKASSHKVVDIESCPLLAPELNETFSILKALLKTRDHGVVSMELALGRGDGKVVAAFYLVGPSGVEKAIGTEELLASTELLKGFEIYRSKSRRAISDGAFRRVKSRGERELRLKVRGMDMLGASTSFTQVNPALNERLIEKVIEFSEVKETDSVLDLFCGIGNLTVPLGGLCASALGIERERQAIEYARRNAKKTGGESIQFDSEDVVKWLKNNGIKSLASPSWDVVILDPPRGGELDAVKSLIKLSPQRIVYVSCSPPTLARDISFLRENGYAVSRSVVLDMFPQTFHIESVVGLVRR